MRTPFKFRIFSSLPIFSIAFCILKIWFSEKISFFPSISRKPSMILLTLERSPLLKRLSVPFSRYIAISEKASIFPSEYRISKSISITAAIVFFTEVFSTELPSSPNSFFNSSMSFLLNVKTDKEPGFEVLCIPPASAPLLMASSYASLKSPLTGVP